MEMIEPTLIAYNQIDAIEAKINKSKVSQLLPDLKMICMVNKMPINRGRSLVQAKEILIKSILWN
jgi:hypothetical protein